MRPLLLNLFLLFWCCESVITDQLLHYFDFNNPDDLFHDSGSLHSTGFCARPQNCPTFVKNAGKFAGGIALNNQFFEVQGSPKQRIDKITMAAWALSTARNIHAKIISKPITTERWAPPFSSWLLSFQMAEQDGFATQGMIADTVTNIDTLGPNLTLNTWNHVASTFDGSVLKLYVNGAMISSRAINFKIGYPAVDPNICIGARSGSDPDEFLLGRMDEVAIWSRALTDSEIQTLATTELATLIAITSEPSTTDTGNRDIIVIGVIVGVIVLLLVIIVSVACVIFTRRRRMSTKQSLGDLRTTQSISSNQLLKHDSGGYSQFNRNLVQILPELRDYVISPGDMKINPQAIGTGSSGVVYKGLWRNTAVAVKQLKTENVQELMKFQEECKLMKNITNHRNVVQFIGLLENPLSLITEFCESGSLDNFLYGKSDMNVAGQVAILQDIVQGMIHLQRYNVVHRDLAARNCLLTDSVVKVSDFGMSKMCVDNASLVSLAVIGPLKWMAPEVFTHSRYSFRTDVYSFGVLCIEVLTRDKPYPDIPLDKFSINVLAHDLTSRLHTYIPNHTPDWMRRIILQCISKDPAQRPTFEAISRSLRTPY